MYGLDRKRYFWVCASALVQGLLLGEYFYTSSGFFLTMPLPLVVVVPFSLWLGQEHWGRRLRRFLWGMAALLAVFHAYWLWSVFPAEPEIYYLPTQNMNLVRICAAVFLLLPFFQCRMATWSWRVPYSEVFFQLCRNFFLLFQAVIVTAIFWSLLLTASLLFDIIGLDSVPQITFSPFVAVPLTSLTIALSITLALRHPGIDSLGRWILAILAWLLPPFSILSAVFVVALPFSGLRTLWDTGQASSLMLLLQFATIMLANAAWLDGTRTPFRNKAIETVTKLSLLCLPIYITLCFYSLGLRIQQYGWSVDRIHAAFFVVIAGIWGIGYAGIILLRQWPSAIGRVNTAAAVALACVVVLMNSPVLDPYRLSANNQAERLMEGRIHPENFDFLYLRFNLGRYGNYALARLAEERGIPNEDSMREELTAALTVSAREHWRNFRSGLVSEKMRRQILSGAKVFPAGPEAGPEARSEATDGKSGNSLSAQIVNGLASQWGMPEFSQLYNIKSSSELAFVFAKLTSGDEEHLLLVKSGVSLVFDVASAEPRLVGTVYGLDPLGLTSVSVGTAAPRFRDITLNGQRYQIQLEYN